MSSNQYLIDALTSRQIFIERYSKGESKRLLKQLNSLSSQLKTLINSEYERTKAISLAKKVETLTNKILTGYGGDLTKGLEAFAKEEAQFAGQAIVAATTATKYNAPSLNLINAILTKEKMELISGDTVKKLTVDQAITAFTKSKSKEIAQIVRDGATVGRTSQEIAREITSLVDTRTRQQAESLVRTVTNFTGGQARQATYKENDDVIVGEEYVATLDSRTTITCAGFDGKIFPIGEGPIPPIHWGCRSVRIPSIDPEFNLGAQVTGERASIDGPVSAQTTYGGWLKRQSHEVQDEVLGVERAKLFRSGKISIGNFTDDIGKVYTLDELKRLNPLAFPKE